jgi:nucleoside-diphosphate-sugar epimerase
MSKILITGVTGFTGRYLAPKLADAGYEVHGTVHGEAGPDVPGLSKLHSLDIGDADAVSRLVSAIAPEKVVHLAAISFVAHLDIAAMYRTNILGTRNLLDALTNIASPPSAVLLASSANIYGNAREGMLDERVPPAPANDYGVTKATGELVTSLYRDRLPLIVVRPFNYTGRGQSEQFVIPKIVSHVRRREPEIELGNLHVARDFSDVRGVADAYARLLETPAAIGGLFNICSGHAVSLHEILGLAQQISGHALRVRVNPAFVRAGEVKSLCGSAARLKSVIGPLAMPPLDQTLRWMLEA